jgi:hypothetical protein
MFASPRSKGRAADHNPATTLILDRPDLIRALTAPLRPRVCSQSCPDPGLAIVEAARRLSLDMEWHLAMMWIPMQPAVDRELTVTSCREAHAIADGPELKESPWQWIGVNWHSWRVVSSS